MINAKYIISLSGEYNASISICPECQHDLKGSDLAKNIIGFTDAPLTGFFRGGMVAIVECPKCFTHWYFHSRDVDDDGWYHYFLAFLKYNPHYK